MPEKPKKRRLLPKNITEQSDAIVAEKLFGKRAKRELDRLLIDVAPKSMS